MKREKRSSPTFLRNNLWSYISIVIYLPQRIWKRRWLLAKCGIWSELIWTTLASFPFLFLYVMARQNICCSAREFVKGDMDIYLFWNRSTNHRIVNNPRHFHKGLDLNVTPTHTMFIKWAQWSGRLITLPTVQPTLRQLHAHCTPLRP